MVVRSAPGWSARIAASLQETMPAVVAAGMAQVEDEAKRLVYLGHPDHLEKKTGALQASITTEVTTDAATVTASTGTSLPYAPVHEFGAAITDRYGTTRIIPPRPFLIPAFAATKEQVRTTVTDGIRAILREHAV